MNPLARWLEDFFFDLSFALLQLLRNPPVSAVCVLTLALVFGVNGSAERLQFSVVTNSFLSILGVQPVLGRTFTAAEAVSGASAKVFVASNSLWRRQLGADPQILGKTYLLDGEPYTLIGVLPADFHFPGTCDIWLPIGT